MSRLCRAVLTACILGLGAALGGCENFDIDKLTDMFENKKPIAGDRKPLFPQGVPGVPQGVPADMMKGHAQAAAEAPPAAPAPGTEAKEAAAKPKPKPRPKKAVVKIGR